MISTKHLITLATAALLTGAGTAQASTLKLDQGKLTAVAMAMAVKRALPRTRNTAPNFTRRPSPISRDSAMPAENRP